MLIRSEPLYLPGDEVVIVKLDEYCKIKSIARYDGQRELWIYKVDCLKFGIESSINESLLLTPDQYDALRVMNELTKYL